MVQLKLRLINFCSILLCLIPISLQTGPFIPDLFLSLISIIIIYLIISEKKYEYFRSTFFKIFIIYYFYLLFLSLTSVYPISSLESSLFYFRFGLFTISVWYLLDNNKKLIKLFTYALLFTFIFVLVDGYYQFFFNYNVFGFFAEGSRLSLVFNHQSSLGGYLARLFPLLIGLLLFTFNYSKLNIILTVVLLISVDLLIYISGERTSLGLLFISTTLIILLISKFKLLRLLTFLISLLLMVFLTYTNDDIRERNIDHTINQMNLNSDKNDIILFSAEHQKIYNNAILIFRDNPILGVGPKLFRKYCKDEIIDSKSYQCSTHPHNTYLQLLSETGIIGFIFIIICFIYIIWLMLRHGLSLIKGKNNLIDDYRICILICFFITLWPLIPSQSFYNNWINIIYFLPVGFYLNSFSKKD